jgi:hypothetical protein
MTKEEKRNRMIKVALENLKQRLLKEVKKGEER